jgi:hypothetical protein
MTLRLGYVSYDERHAAWTRVIERIYTEQLDQAWSHYIFRLLRAVFDKNKKLSEEGGFIFDWIAKNYVDAALMLLRRELDQQAGTENLRNLLLDIIEHPGVLTRARYRASWGDGGGFERGRADRVFDSFDPKRVPENTEEDYIDPDVVRADLDQVVADAERLRVFAERTRAHRTPERKVDTSDITFRDLHKAIADARRVVEKYYALLTLKSIGQWEPVPLYDTLAPFMKPWVVDRNEVAAEVQEGGEE